LLVLNFRVFRCQHLWVAADTSSVKTRQALTAIKRFDPDAYAAPCEGQGVTMGSALRIKNNTYAREANARKRAWIDYSEER